MKNFNLCVMHRSPTFMVIFGYILVIIDPFKKLPYEPYNNIPVFISLGLSTSFFSFVILSCSGDSCWPTSKSLSGFICITNRKSHHWLRVPTGKKYNRKGCVLIVLIFCSQKGNESLAVASYLYTYGWTQIVMSGRHQSWSKK